MSKTIKKTIIFIAIIVLVIIIILIFGILNNNKKNESDYVRQEPPANIIEQEVNKTVRKCDITGNYFIIKNIINKYYAYCNKLLTTGDKIEVYRNAISEEAMKKYREEQAKKEINIAKDYIYNILDTEYLDEFNVSREDLPQKFGMDNQVDILIKNMYMAENSETISTYFIDGMAIDIEKGNKKDFYIAIRLDITNYTFCIYPEEYCKKKGYDNILDGFEMEGALKNIENKKYNKFNYVYSIPDEDIVKEYFYTYKYSMMYDLENAYNMLNQEYRKKRFGKFDNFKKYIKENYEVLSQNIISKYQAIGNEENKKYICLDEKGNYYIFNQKNIGDYNLYLDTYTIETEDFLEKYNNSDESKKAGMNAEKFFEAINMKDYDFIYNHLSKEFKDRYYQSKEDLEKYLKENLFIYNSREYKDSSKEDDVYLLKVVVSDKYKEGSEKNMTVVVKLKEGTDFVMSFSIN